MDYRVTTFEKHSDARGQLVVFLKSSELKNRRKKFGQIYFITFNRKGVIRGNHYHKQWREWFGVVNGIVQVKLEDVKTKEGVSLVLTSKGPVYSRLEIGPNIAHTFKSLTSEASLLNYGDREWSARDRYHYQLLGRCKGRGK